MIIRDYVVTDAPEITAILNYYIQNSTALYDYRPKNLEEQVVQLQQKLAQDYPVLVAIENQKLVGFGYYGSFRPRDAYQFTVEHSVYVASDCLGKGIGKELLSGLITAAKKQNRHTLIGVIDAENQNSILFHEKMGFKTVGIIKEAGYKFNRWLDSVFMQLLLK